MNKWTIGEKNILVKNKKFNLSAERVVSKKINKKFNSEIFKFKIKLQFHDNINNLLELNDSNIDTLKDGLEKIFNKVKSSYRKRDGPFYIQMNLSFDGLKKEFLKSGIVDLFGNVDSKNIVYWLINQLDQVNQSSDNLIFSNNLFIDILIIKTVKPSGKNNDCSKIFTISKFSDSISKIVKKIKNNYFFINEIKKGFVDMSLYFEEQFFEDSFNCILISIYFGLIYDKFNNDMKKTLIYIDSKFRSLEHFQKIFIKEYNLFEIGFFSGKTNIKLYDYISKIIKKNILIFVKKKNNSCKLIYSTNHKNINCLKILIEEDHCKFVFNNINLEQKNKTFCDYCLKSFFKINLHKCKREKCINCFFYKNSFQNEFNFKICHNNKINNTNYTCKYCFKTMTNSDCKIRHMTLNVEDCTRIMFCQKCENFYYKKSPHTCGEFFCKKCLKQHSKQYFCSTTISLKKKHIKETVFFLDLKYVNKCLYYISISEFVNNNLIIIYYFYKNYDFYKKIIFNTQSFIIENTEIINCNVNLDIIDIIEILDMSNLKPKFILEQRHFDYFINNIYLLDSKVLSKDSLIYCIKYKYFSLMSINQYITYDPLFILKHSNLELCPFYLIDLDHLNLSINNNMSNLVLSDFTKSYKNSDYNMFEYLYYYKNDIKHINELNYSEFIEKSTIYRFTIFIYSINSINSILKTINSEMKSYVKSNEFKFKCITQKQSFSSSVFNLFLNTLDDQKLPTLSSSTPGNINNTSKYEICFCETLTELHLKQFTNHSIKSYINGNGEQFSKDKFSLDW